MSIGDLFRRNKSSKENIRKDEKITEEDLRVIKDKIDSIENGKAQNIPRELEIIAEKSKEVKLAKEDEFSELASEQKMIGKTDPKRLLTTGCIWKASELNREVFRILDGKNSEIPQNKRVKHISISNKQKRKLKKVLKDYEEPDSLEKELLETYKNLEYLKEEIKQLRRDYFNDSAAEQRPSWRGD